ncbi:amino acid ABC transporter ATP-binding protein [Asaccharospora irregularis]|uniref:Polar amino acid transport system ATP-binding protein n=1 Tax=Asaccharospora irregularis DSM 2635 TaxID=1121321 RepID=A0A1M5M9U5_9FIRM|nr:amino acid ABC transporter ATP-binding protein [Asaccharospora irregularis]SHG74038.1 polar amino acid transport system ATP-binding protein [Asaccharospora irregularis DSM 2635]
MAELIKVNNISKSFGDNTVLKNLDLTILKGEVIAIIGSSGSGKSTLVRCMAGLENTENGEILLKDKIIQNVKSTNGLIGMVFQNFNLFPHYTVLENLTKPCQTVKKMNSKDAKEKAMNLLKKVHLQDKFNQYPSTLSGGQKQRVAIARALSMDPEIIIFDEPTSSLDPELAHEVFETISTLAHEGQTMVIVTHQINAIRHFATRVLFLNKGQIEEEGTPKYIFEECTNPKLKKFLQIVDYVDLD